MIKLFDHHYNHDGLDDHDVMFDDSEDDGIDGVARWTPLLNCNHKAFKSLKQKSQLSR